MDEIGRKWEAYEAPIPYDRRGASSLVFNTVDLARRVRDFPPDWYDLPDSALIELCNQRR